MDATVKFEADRRQNRGFVLGALSAGHAIAHLYDHGLPVLMPTIASAMRLSTVQVSILVALRQVGFGATNLGGGLFVDMFKGHWGPMLTWCLLGTALAFGMLGVSPVFWALLIVIAVASIPGAFWHLPSAASLSQRFPDRRGFAFSIHGFGANVGNILGPLAVTRLLTLMGSWRHVAFVYTIPAFAMGLFSWWAFRDLGRRGETTGRRGLGLQVRDTVQMMRNPIVLGLVAAGVLRAIGLDAVFQWTPFYLERELGHGHLKAGFLYALLTGTGVVSAPVLGILSDRFGRKVVLLPGLAVAAVLLLFVVGSGDTVFLSLVLAGVGLFSFSLHQIIQAALLDVVGQGTEATAIGLIFGLEGVVGGVALLAVPILIDHFGGYGSIFYYAGVLTAVSAAITMVLPLRPKLAPVAAEV